MIPGRPPKAWLLVWTPAHMPSLWGELETPEEQVWAAVCSLFSPPSLQQRRWGECHRLNAFWQEWVLYVQMSVMNITHSSVLFGVSYFFFPNVLSF